MSSFHPGHPPPYDDMAAAADDDDDDDDDDGGRAMDADTRNDPRKFFPRVRVLLSPEYEHVSDDGLLLLFHCIVCVWGGSFSCRMCTVLYCTTLDGWGSMHSVQAGRPHDPIFCEKSCSTEQRIREQCQDPYSFNLMFQRKKNVNQRWQYCITRCC
jgi:hypothetical protein